MVSTIILIVLASILLLAIIIITADTIIACYSPKQIQSKTAEGDSFLIHDKEIAKKMKEDSLYCLNLPYEDAYTESYDNKKLHARLYIVKEGAPVVILMHGYRGIGYRDFCNILPYLLKHEYNVLMIDQRACGESEGHAITFGIKERKDSRTWVYYILKKFGRDTKIALFGISLGGASVLMATELNMPHALRCIIADCPYSSPRDIILKVCNNIKLPPALTFTFLRIGAYLYCRFNLEGASAKEAVKHTDIPIQLIHGEEDSFVPAFMSKAIEEQCFGYVERYTFPNADHAISSLVDPDRYEKITIEFLDKHLKNS